MEQRIEMDKIKFKKMLFIQNAIENGWTVKKSGMSYIFKKKHEHKREIFQNDYIERFLAESTPII